MNLSLIAVGAVMGLRLLLFKLGRPPEGADFMLVHFLAIVTVVFFTGQRLLNADARTTFPDLMREGFKSAAVYAVIYGLFLLAYYHWVEPAHFTTRVNDMVARGIADGQPETVIRPRLEKFFTPFNYASMTFFALLLAGGFNALAVGLLHHKMLRKLRR
ncbi:MAG: hypothetical protein KF797_03175 [Flavobacteriales bacterium]|nr:hypothetical protein [Flavobacteriales bacterium]